MAVRSPPRPVSPSLPAVDLHERLERIVRQVVAGNTDAAGQLIADLRERCPEAQDWFLEELNLQVQNLPSHLEARAQAYTPLYQAKARGKWGTVMALCQRRLQENPADQEALDLLAVARVNHDRQRCRRARWLLLIVCLLGGLAGGACAWLGASQMLRRLAEALTEQCVGVTTAMAGSPAGADIAADLQTLQRQEDEAAAALRSGKVGSAVSLGCAAEETLYVQLAPRFLLERVILNGDFAGAARKALELQGSYPRAAQFRVAYEQLLVCQARQTELESSSLPIPALLAETGKRIESARDTLQRGQLAEATETLQGLGSSLAAHLDEVSAVRTARQAYTGSLAEVGIIVPTDVLYDLFARIKETSERAATVAGSADVKGATDLWNEATRLLAEELKPAQRFEKLLVAPAGSANPELQRAAESIATRYARAQAFLDLLKLSRETEDAIAAVAAASPDASTFTALLTQELERALQPASAGRIQESSDVVARTLEKAAQLRALAPMRNECRALLSELEGLYQGLSLPKSVATLSERAAQAESAANSLDFSRAIQAWQELGEALNQEPALLYVRAMKQGNSEDAGRIASAGLAKAYPPAAKFLADQRGAMAPLRQTARALLAELEGLYQGIPLPQSVSTLSGRAAQAESAAESIEFARAIQAWQQLGEALKREPTLAFTRALKQGNAEEARRLADAGLANAYPPAAEFLEVMQQLAACRAMLRQAEAAAPAAARDVLTGMHRDLDRVTASIVSAPLAQSAATLKQVTSSAEYLVRLAGLYPADVARLALTDDMDDAGKKALPAVTALMAELDGALRLGQLDVAIDKAPSAREAIRKFISTPILWRRWTIGDLGMEFRQVHPGSFRKSVPGSWTKTVAQWGGGPITSASEHTVKVVLSRFWMGRSTVTRAQFSAVMGYLPVRALPGEGNDPNGVTPASANEFCRRLTHREAERGSLPAGYAYRRPTEAQWEYYAQVSRDVETTTEEDVGFRVVLTSESAP